MSLVVSCPCGQQFASHVQLVGQSVACPGCGQLLLVPPPPADPFQKNPLGPPPGGAYNPGPYDSRGQQAGPQYVSPPPSDAYPAYGNSPPQKSNAGLYVALGIGGVLLFGFLLVGAGLFAGYRAFRTTTNRIRASAQIAKAQNDLNNTSRWTSHRPTAADFSIRMPRTAKQSNRSVSHFTGSTRQYSLRFEHPDGTLAVTWHDLPNSVDIRQPHSLMERYLSAAARANFGSVDRQSATSSRGFPARDFHITGLKMARPVEIQGRIYLADKRIYIVEATGETGKIRPATTQFLVKTFHINRRATPTFTQPSLTTKPAPPVKPTPAKPTPTKPTPNTVVRQPTPGAPTGIPANRFSSRSTDPKTMSDAQKRSIYIFARIHIQSYERMAEMYAKRPQRTSSRGTQTMLESRRRMRDSQLDTLCRSHGITRSQLDEIVAEGKANEW